MKTLCYASPVPLIYILYNMPTRPPDKKNLALRQRRTFAQNFRKARKAAGITQEQLVEKTGMTQGYISNLENGQKTVSMDNANILADAIGQPLWKLISPEK